MTPQLVVAYCYRRAVLGRLTLNVVHCIRIWSFVVVDHLDDLQQIVFTEFLESVCEFVHVDLHAVS